jgi:hypothetical protein
LLLLHAAAAAIIAHATHIRIFRYSMACNPTNSARPCAPADYLNEEPMQRTGRRDGRQPSKRIFYE